jgi:chorismate dehydratase
VKQKLKISVVSYLNSRPFIEGILLSPFQEQIELSLDIPALCAAKLLDGRVDVGLVPVAVIPLLKEYHIITDYCIGSDGAVRSVCLYSDVPLKEIRTIILDNQSRSSVALVKILCEKLWKISPDYTLAKDGYESEIGKSVAGVVIGDRTFALKNRFAYTYDLSEAWKTLTGLPFVFACWVSNKQIDPETIAVFNKALGLGLSEISRVVTSYKDVFPADADLDEYLRKNISYNLDERKRKGLKQFLELLPQKSLQLKSS